MAGEGFERADRRRCACFLVCTALLFAARYAPAESLEPVPTADPIRDLSVSVAESSHDITLHWSGGSPPFTIVRGDSACFRDAERIWLVAENVDDRHFVDRRAQSIGARLYYRVFDKNSPPEAHWIVQPDSRRGRRAEIRGVAFDRNCARNAVYIDGVPAEVIDCNFIQLVVLAPQDRASGKVVVETSAGADVVGAECVGVASHARTWRDPG
jgi:hypothetical protein